MTTVVLGAGFAGLGAVSALQREGRAISVLEAAGNPGGLAATDVVDGFMFDRTGHFLHARTAEFKELLTALPLALDEFTRRSSIVMGDVRVPYPIQFNLWALPKEARRQAFAEMRRPAPAMADDASFEEVVQSTWGELLTRQFFRPYNEKLWCRPLESLPGDCGGRFLPRRDLGLVREGMNGPVLRAGYNPQLLYPTSGMFGDVAGALALHLAADVEYHSPVTSIDVKDHSCVVEDRARPYGDLVSTASLPALLDLCDLAHLREKHGVVFEYADVLNLRIGFKGRVRCPEHWLYIPEPSIPFYRVGFPSNVNRRSCPPGCASLSLEYGLLPGAAVGATVAQATDEAMRYLSRVQLIDVEEVLVAQTLRISPGYVLTWPDQRRRVAALRSELAAMGIHSVGRYGAWDYFSMEDSYLSGAGTARPSGRPSSSEVPG